MLRGLPRTIALADTHSWRSSLKSIRHGVDGHDTPFSVSVASASAGS